VTAGSATRPGALAGLRVLELSDGVAAAYATKLFADLGAAVVKIEPPAGDSTRRCGLFPDGRPDPERSGLFLYLNANKDGIVLDLARAADREAFRRLVAASDLLVHDTPLAELESADLGWNRLSASQPALVMTTIAPFGISGPYAAYHATDLISWAAGGIAYLNGGGPGGEDQPPLKAFGQQASF